MESLANEKRLLELKLASEKRNAVNEKESLADRLKDALERSLKAESTYEVRVDDLYLQNTSTFTGIKKKKILYL